MTPKRYNKLNKDGVGLTEEELKQGWHWCWEWDLMLVGPGMAELNCCDCENDFGLCKELAQKQKGLK